MADRFIIIQVIGMLIIAGITVYIAWQQYKTNKDKLRLALSDKRRKMFQALMKLHVYVVHPADVLAEKLHDYTVIFMESQFLFDKDIRDYLDEVYNQAVSLQANKEYITHAKGISPDEASKVNAEIHEITNWFLENFKKEKGRFEKYLRFDKI